MAVVKAKVAATCLMENEDRLETDGCSIDLTEAPKPLLIINFDRLGSPIGNNDTRPDFLLTSDTGGVSNEGGRRDPGLIAPVEMSKSKSKTAPQIKKQLQAGVNWLDNVPDGFQPTLWPVYCGLMRLHLSKELRKPIYQIEFRGQKELPRIAPWNKNKKPPKFPTPSK